MHFKEVVIFIGHFYSRLQEFFISLLFKIDLDAIQG